MRVSDADRAREQWEGILHGSRAARDERSLVYQWPGSPMVLTIDVDPSGGEGPIAVELASSRPVDLPEALVRELGTTFRLIQP